MRRSSWPGGAGVESFLVKRRAFFITGTDTGAGKTVVATLLARHWRERGLPVAGFKPVCSGGRADAEAMQAALGGALELDEINPWHFRAALTPLLAARAEKRRVKLAQVVARARELQERFPLLIVEGAGGLLSPLGEDFDSRDLIRTLRALPVVVAPNKLGVINQVLLTLAALPSGLSQKAVVILVAQPEPDVADRGNVKFLAGKLGRRRVCELPWMDSKPASAVQVRRSLEALTRLLGL